MKSFVHLFLYAACICTLMSCRHAVDKNEMQLYISDASNGLYKETQHGSYKMSVSYRPVDLLVEQESKTIVTEEEWMEKRKEYEDYHYFVLSMSNGNRDVLYQTSGTSDFSSTLYRLNFEIAKYIYALSDNKDTLYLADYYVPNLYGMGGNTHILLAFPSNHKGFYNELEVCVKDLGFGTGTHRFLFKRKDLQKIPEFDFRRYCSAI